MHLIAMENCPTSRAGGQEHSLFEVCRGLSRQGVAVTLLYAEPGDRLDEYAAFCRRVVRVESRYVTPRTGGRFAADVLRTLRALHVSSPVTVYGNRYFDLPFACALGKLLGARVCGHLRIPAPPYLSRQYRLGIRIADACIAISESIKTGFVACGAPASRIRVIHNGVDPDRFTPPSTVEESRRRLGIPEDANVVLYAGRLCRDKGLDVLIDALALVRHRRLHLAVAGDPASGAADPAYLAMLAAAIQVSGLSSRVHFLGHVADMRLAYGAADINVLPSRCAEGFGRTIIEAMACGVPSVGAAVGGIPEVLSGEFRRFCVPAENPIALATTLDGLADWRQREPDLGRRCREYAVGRFSFQRMLKQLAAVLFPRIPSPEIRAIRQTTEPAACMAGGEG